jgi:hypothetical protein
MAAETGRPANGDEARVYGQLVVQAWRDDTFKARLLAEPEAVLGEEGLPVPPGRRVTAREVAPDETYIVLRPLPPAALASPAPEGSWGAVLVRAATDPAYTARLQAEPAAALAEQGIALPAGRRVAVLDASDTQDYFLIPPPPDGIDLEALADDTAGFFNTPYSDAVDAWLASLAGGGGSSGSGLPNAALPSPAVLAPSIVDFRYAHRGPNPDIRNAFRP